MPPILVTGGTGTLGRAVVTRLLAAGRDVRVLSRRPADRVPGGAGLGDAGWAVGDLSTGAGLDEALDRVTAVVHCASDLVRSRRDIAATRNLIAAAGRHGAPHLVYISIVGVDQVPLGYYRVKLEAERIIEESGLPWTILRATQFHDLIFYCSEQAARLPVMAVPAGISFQPVDAGDVASRLSELATGPPAGRAPDFGGPEVLPATELARVYLDHAGRRRPLVAVRLPGKVFAAYRQGRHLAPGHADGRRTYCEFLAANIAQVRSWPASGPSPPRSRTLAW